MSHIHQVEEPEACNECNGDGMQLDGAICYLCEGKGGTSPGWYFWDETQAYRYGPYESEEEANKQLDRYCKEVLG